MRRVITTLLLALTLMADSVDLIEFENDLFSKYSKNLKKVAISLHLEGQNLQINSYSIQDSLNIVLSSFYLEDLLTSKGKEEFKEALKKYLKNRHKIRVDSVYILKLTQVDLIPDIDKLIEALKKNGCCSMKGSSIKKKFEDIE